MEDYLAGGGGGQSKLISVPSFVVWKRGVEGIMQSWVMMAATERPSLNLGAGIILTHLSAYRKIGRNEKFGE